MKFYNTSFLDLNHYFCSFVLYIRGPLVFQFFTVTCLPSLNKVDYYYYYYGRLLKIFSYLQVKGQFEFVSD